MALCVTVVLPTGDGQIQRRTDRVVRLPLPGFGAIAGSVGLSLCERRSSAERPAATMSEYAGVLTVAFPVCSRQCLNTLQ